MSIVSADEQRFVSLAFMPNFMEPQYPYTSGPWTGYTRKHNQWAWSDGSSSNFTSWASGEPNNSGGHEDCSVMWVNMQGNRIEARFAWNDSQCNDLRPYICKTKQWPT